MISLYFLFTKDFDQNQIEGYSAYLSEEELKKRERFIFQKDKELYTLTRSLTRKIIAQKLGREPNELEFDKTPYGKPFLKSPDSAVNFSVSHTSGIISLAISENTETLGIDIENCSRPRKLDTIMAAIFTPDEIAALLLLPHAAQQSRFYDLWTLRESYIKSLGLGFHLPPKSFGFHFEESAFYLQKNYVNTEQNFHFLLLHLTDDYRFALCYAGTKKIIEAFRVNSNWDCILFKFPAVKSTFKSA